MTGHSRLEGLSIKFRRVPFRAFSQRRVKRWVIKSPSSAPPAMWAARCWNPGRARLPGRRGRRARVAPQPGHRGLLRRQDAQVQEPRALRFLRRRHLPDVGGLARRQGMVAEDRRRRRGGDRQLVVLALRLRRAADRARGQCRRGRGLPQEGHHRQSELLDRAARRRAQAAARQGEDQARRGRDLSVGVRRRQGSDGRAVLADQGRLHLGRARDEEVSQAHRLQPDPAHRRVHGGRLHEGRMEDGGRDQEDPRPQDQAHRHLRARAGVHRPFARPSTSSSRSRSRPTRRARSCAARRAAW